MVNSCFYFKWFVLVFVFLASSNFSTKAQILPPDNEMTSERVLGKSSAPLTVIEYASLTCSHCADFHNQSLPAIKKQYINTGKIKFIYRDFPTDQLALAASMLARCAPIENYFGLIGVMYETQAKWRQAADPQKALMIIGRLAGMSQDTIDACLKNQPVFDAVMKQRNRGNKEFKIDATPTLLVNGEKLSGGMPIKQLLKALDEAYSNSIGKK